MVKPHHLVVSLRDIEFSDIHHVGEHAMTSRDGFVVTSNAYFKFLRDNMLENKIRQLIDTINFVRDDSLAQVCYHIKNLIEKTKIPDDIIYKVSGHYIDLGAKKVVAHMSIITGDQGQIKAFGKKFNEVDGDSVLLNTIRSMWAHLFDPRLVSYRYNNGVDHLKTGVSITVRKN